MKACLLPLLLAAGLPGVVHAQDTRTVTEPAPPPACAILTGEAFAPERNDGPRIQAAIDACAPGHAVVLAASNAKRSFVSGPLLLKTGVTLVVDEGATLYASSDPKLFDRGSGTCGSNDQNGRGCRPLITAENTRGSGIMGRGTIDGRGGEKILGTNESWWQIARRAQKEKTRQNVPRLIQVDKSQDFTMAGILLKNSPNFHVTLNQVDGFTAWGVKIDTPHDARNTDGIDPISSKNITIAHSWIRTGDDNVAIKGGSNGPTENVSILHNHFYSGHGMSIGSETNGGVRRVLVEDLSMDGTTSGLRIKSNDKRGGTVSDILYRDVCLRGTKAPIDITTHYEQADKPGSLVPDYRDVRMERVHSLTPGKINLQGYDDAHPLRLRLADVVVDGQPVVKTEFAQVTGAASFLGEAAAPVDCSGRFPAFPAEPVRNPRPQLSAEQAKAFEAREVLKYVGTVGAERVDRWDPLADPLATGARFMADDTVDAGASVQAAVNKAIAAGAKGKRIYIRIRPGVYRELLYVPAGAPPITLYSEDPDPRAVRIVAGLDASTTGADYRRLHGAQFDGAPPSVRAMYEQLKDLPALSTGGSGTAWIRADGFQARNITIENAFNRGGARARTECVGDGCPDNTGGSRVHHQAVALRVDGADRVQFENLRLLGLQDTLFLNAPDQNSTVRSYFHKSYVEGDVDFIFGDSIAYFDDCEIKSIAGRAASYALAPDTSRRAKYGFVFNGCRFTADKPAASETRFYLARQWFHNQRCTPYGWMAVEGYRCRLGDSDVYRAPEGTIRLRTLESVGKAVILNSRIGAHIDRDNPWSEWNRMGTMAHRPAQFDSYDFWANLEAVHPTAGLDVNKVLGGKPRPAPAEIYLGEYNNTNE
ncbi:pectinesterase family protein [Massilia aerilata]|uniref:Pectinesterase family protein n=1 Tax=Massilia aerilata TaxID=453817 RepID=A0ABW0RX55_9BURK